MALFHMAHRRDGEDCVEIARVVERGITESKAVDTESLCIASGVKVPLRLASLGCCQSSVHMCQRDGTRVHLICHANRVPKRRVRQSACCVPSRYGRCASTYTC